MAEQIPFRDLRRYAKILKIQAGLILAMPGIDWPQEDYVRYFGIKEVDEKTENPSYRKQLVILGAWGALFRLLLDRLPESTLRAEGEKQYSEIWPIVERALKDGDTTNSDEGTVVS